MEQSSTGVPLLPQKQYWSVAPHRLHYTPGCNWLMTWNQALGNQWSYMIPYITHRYQRLIRNLPPIPLVLDLSTQLPIETAPGERVVCTNDDGHRPPFFSERKKKYILSGCKKKMFVIPTDGQKNYFSQQIMNIYSHNDLWLPQGLQRILLVCTMTETLFVLQREAGGIHGSVWAVSAQH